MRLARLAQASQCLYAYEPYGIFNSLPLCLQLLLCSLYEIYRALEEELDRNSSHPGVAPIYFPQELARLESLEKDLEYFHGQNWRERVIISAATHRYAQRLRKVPTPDPLLLYCYSLYIPHCRDSLSIVIKPLFLSQIGKENPEFLVAHAYTRYLGDLSGGQILGRITQKSLGLRSGEGMSFFSFPGVTSPNLFKQLYRSRMNSIELNKEERDGVLKEAVTAFECNIEVSLEKSGERLLDVRIIFY